MAKTKINGTDAHPLFKYLRSNTKELRSKKDPNLVLEVPWNFSRWLIDSKGKVHMYLHPAQDITESYSIVEKLINYDASKSKPQTIEVFKFESNSRRTKYPDFANDKVMDYDENKASR